MKIRDFSLVTDENVSPIVVAYWRSLGFDVWDVCESGWDGRSDREILDHANRTRRIIVTSDGDYATLMIRDSRPGLGVIRFRPGHLPAPATTSLIDFLLDDDPDLNPPFVVTLMFRASGINLRNRSI
jgi:predicted nuclease of predicted toxin-antitoxin system